MKKNKEFRDYNREKIPAKGAGLFRDIPVFLLGLIIVVSTGFLSCAGAGTEYSEVIINVGAGTKAMTWPPDDVVSYTLTVSGSDFGTLQAVFPGGVPAVSMLVPKGSGRTIVLEAYKDLASDSAVINWRGKSTVNLESDSVQVDVPMDIGKTKLVVADTCMQSGGIPPKIFQINDISGTDWGTKEIREADLGTIWSAGGGSYLFYPYDVELDNRGRIYVANNGSGITQGALVWRIDSINDTTEDVLIDTTGTDTGYEAIGIDRINGYIYVSGFNSGTLYRTDLNGNGLVTLNTAAGADIIGRIRGIAVNSEGILYISGQNSAIAPRIFRYDPAAQIVTDSYSNPNFSTFLFDVMAKDNFIYVANMAGPNGWQIIRLTEAFSDPVGYGNHVSVEDHSPGAFYDARRFVAITNKKITIVDDTDSFDQLDKLISFNDMQGTEWQTFPPTGNGSGFFNFYWC